MLFQQVLFEDFGLKISYFLGIEEEGADIDGENMKMI